MKKLLLFCIPALSLITLNSYASGAKPSGKPRPPIQISVTPVQAGLLAEDIRPGDTVDLKVTAVSLMDANEMRVEVKLSGGTELVSGETEWRGAVKKNEEKTLVVTVRAPQKGKGEVKARAVIPVSDEISYSALASYPLGWDPKKEEKPMPPVKKDSKGRDIIEYKVK